MEIIPVLTLGAGAVGSLFLTGFWRWYYRPQLEVEFNPRPDGCKMPTKEQVGNVLRDSAYFSIKVTNIGRRQTAEKCRGFLAGIDYKDSRGVWQPTEYCDSMPLVWAYRSGQGIDIPVGISQLLNVFSESDGDAFFIPRTDPSTLPLRHNAFQLFQQPGEFRFKIYVTADGARRECYCLSLKWPGQFDPNVVVFQNTSWPDVC